MPTAWIIRGTELWIADTLFDLIEGIQNDFETQARTLLRRRIQTLREPSLFERSLIQVAAKRFEIANALPELSRFQVHHVRSPHVSIAPTSRDRKIHAWLFDRELKPIAYAVNTSAVIKTRHAELNLLLEWKRAGKKIPVDSLILTSLKPCAMCSALIWEMAEDLHRIQVVYLENDPGPWGQNTILTEDSPARTRFLAKNSPEFDLKIQFSAHELSRELLLALMAGDRQIHELAQELGITDP